MPGPNLVSWTSTVSSLIRRGHAGAALLEFFAMCNSDLRPNEFGFSLALKASRITGELGAGKLLHGFVMKSGFESHPFCSASILDVYVKCGDMSDASRLFDAVPVKCEALWNTMINGHARASNATEAVSLFHQMLLSCTIPNSYTYTILVKLWAGGGDIDMLKFFHSRTVKAGLDGYNFVGGALVDSYAKQGELSDAIKVFWCLQERDNVIWSALLAGFDHFGDTEQGLDLYLKFISEGYKLDPFMFTSVFNLCSDLQNPLLGLQVHSCFAKSGYVVDSFVCSALIDMYLNFGMLADAYRSFHETKGKNQVIFAAMIHGFVCESDYKSAVELVYEMRKLGLVPDYSTLNCMLRACASLQLLDEGRLVHGQVIRSIGEYDIVVGNNLMDMYSKCNAMDKAVAVFSAMEVRNEFSWTTLISGYIDAERNYEAMELFRNMCSLGVTKPNQYTLVAILQASSNILELCKGAQVHSYIIKSGFQSHAYIEAALIGMYARCGSMDDASKIYSSMSEKDLVSWSTLMAAYAQHGHGEEALKLFSEYKECLITFDESILSSCLSACSSSTGLEMGRCLHATSIKAGFEQNLHVGGAMVDIYCKCGSIKNAWKLFDEMREHSVKSYTTMISGCAQHGLGREALLLFDKMVEVGLEPDGVTFLAVLSACSHLGLVKEGWHYFETMKNCGLARTINHYACMVDLLGRAGCISDAEELINKAAFNSKTFLWRALLGACSKHGDVEAGNRIGKMLMQLEPDGPSTYVLLSNIYASASMWDHSSELQEQIKKGGMKKFPGYSWIEIVK